MDIDDAQGPRLSKWLTDPVNRCLIFFAIFLVTMIWTPAVATLAVLALIGDVLYTSRHPDTRDKIWTPISYALGALTIFTAVLWLFSFV